MQIVCPHCRTPIELAGGTPPEEILCPSCGSTFRLEGRIPETTKELEARGHKVQAGGDWSNGKVMAVQLDAKNGVISGAVSPRGQIGYVSGW